MKRFISLLIALVLLVSMFALPTFALAETKDGEDNARILDFNVDKFIEYVVNNNKGYYVEMGKEFKLNLSKTEPSEEEGKDPVVVWELLKDVDALKEIFGDKLKYQVLPDEETPFPSDWNKTTIIYKSVDPVTEEETEQSGGDKYETEHVTLPDANYFEAPEGYVFAGWLAHVTYDGEIVGEDILYRAGDKFSMPYVTPTYKKDEDGSDLLDDDGHKIIDKLGEIEIYAQWLPEAEEGEEQEKPDYTYPKNDIICLEYCSPSNDPKDENWTRVEADSEITLDSEGFWMFRLVVVDGESTIDDNKAVITPYNTEDFIAARLREDGVNGEEVYHWEEFTLTRYAVDTTNPEVALSTTMKNKMKDGLTVGTNYSISTSLTITDSSSAPATYVVYRHSSANGAGKDETDGWVKIYDSTTREVAEDYKAYISASGTINPQPEDITTEGNYRYKIVYSVKDANGYFGVGADDDDDGTTDENGEFHPTLYLGVNPKEDNDPAKRRMEIWKIILFVIAGLAAVGIVVLLFIKPKDEVVADGASANSDSDADVDVDSVDPDDVE